ncbi:Heavy metal translocatin [Pleurostoma richardsiae]|uniref:Heavy metal translocatin n=1 Tax=Pleurostoma richardsiae TaxID=41990 RepID=A0AA38RVX3_9PEZI|nr:Heavy metal translocatin [Pleurostoma richardsiae]
MACCYIAASMIAFIIRSCEALDINLDLQYNESVKHHKDASTEADRPGPAESSVIGESEITIVSISGMTCAACSTTVEKALVGAKGVQQALVSLALQEARVFHDTSTARDDLITCIENAGYKASVGARTPSQKMSTIRLAEELQSLRRSLQGLGLCSTLIFGFGKGLDLVKLNTYVSHPLLSLAKTSLMLCLTIVAIARYGEWIFTSALSAARRGKVNMHTLICVSTLVGLALSLLKIAHGDIDVQYFDTIIGVLLVITVGRYMDFLSRRRAGDTFFGLYSLMDETSIAKLASQDRRVPSHVLRSGDEIVIEPYTLIPCDSYVISGTSHINEAVITGESFPKTKSVGALLLAGTRNGPNQLRAVVQQDQRGSFLSQLVAGVEASLTTKAPVQHRVDVISRYFVSIIFAIAVTTGAISFFSARERGLAHAVDVAGTKVMAVLAAACPCALGLATPCAVMAGIDIAWRKGILMLGGAETMDAARNLTHVVMDKTGTLTRGAPEVTSMVVNSRWQGREVDLAVLICAAEEEGMAAHPLASALFRKLLPLCSEAWDQYRSHGRMRDSEQIGGHGIRCTVDSGDQNWRSVLVGSLQFMLDNDVCGVEEIPRNATEEGSVVFASIDGLLAASFVLQDALRPDAEATVSALKARSLKVTMLTGDNPSEARRISQQLGIEVLASSATPAAKLNHVKALQQKGHKVLMIGDGMNDAPSLAAAEVGVMMAHGSRCLSSGGSVLILQSQIRLVETLLEISTSTMRQVTANIMWALAYNVFAVALAAGLGSPLNISISPPMAAAMMSMSSIFITMNGLLLRARLARRYSIS